MDPALIELIVQGGSSAAIIYMLLDMRKEAREQREYMQRLLEFLIMEKYPDASMSQITRIPFSAQKRRASEIAQDNRSDVDP